MYGCMPSAIKVCWIKGRLHQGVVPEVQYFSVILGGQSGVQVSLAALCQASCIWDRHNQAHGVHLCRAGLQARLPHFRGAPNRAMGHCWVHACMKAAGRHLIHSSQAHLAGS